MRQRPTALDEKGGMMFIDKGHFTGFHHLDEKYGPATSRYSEKKIYINVEPGLQALMDKGFPLNDLIFMLYLWHGNLQKGSKYGTSKKIFSRRPSELFSVWPKRDGQIHLA